ncbi:MAG: hypothetical protein LH615_02950, partial [Ferruginibacter sp.]|nr:hypothetical protein [Ferruginibacter sp.]
MIKATLPFDEKQRHEELIKFQILDTKEEESFNDLVELAALICNTRSATISFIDTDRVSFKATKNIEKKEAARDISLCSHVILQSDVMIVEDT